MCPSRTSNTTGRLTIWAVSSALGWLACGPVAAEVLQPFSTASAGAALPVPWRVVGLPDAKKPLTKLDIVSLDGERVLRIVADKSYGSAMHMLTPVVPGPGSMLRWRWRLEQPLMMTDLRLREGDDAPVKVCAMFDMSTDKLGLIERNILRLARSRTPEFVPAATLCYVWDHRLPVGTQLPNAFSPRLRYVVMDSGEKQLGQWVKHERDLAADFLHAFGAETDVMPPLVGFAVGADSDNTQSASLAYVGDLGLVIAPSVISNWPAPAAVKP